MIRAIEKRNNEVDSRVCRWHQSFHVDDHLGFGRVLGNSDRSGYGQSLRLTPETGILVAEGIRKTEALMTANMLTFWFVPVTMEVA